MLKQFAHKGKGRDTTSSSHCAVVSLLEKYMHFWLFLDCVTVEGPVNDGDPHLPLNIHPPPTPLQGQIFTRPLR